MVITLTFLCFWWFSIKVFSFFSYFFGFHYYYHHLFLGVTYNFFSPVNLLLMCIFLDSLGQFCKFFFLFLLHLLSFDYLFEQVCRVGDLMVVKTLVCFFSVRHSLDVFNVLRVYKNLSKWRHFRCRCLLV